MQVALDPTPRLVARCHDSGSRLGECRPSLGIRNGSGHQLGELADTALRSIRDPIPHGCCDDGTPQPPVNDNRAASGRPDAELT